MKIITNFSLVLVLTSVGAAQIRATKNELSENPLFRHLIQSTSDSKIACEGATATTARPYPDPDDCTQFYYCTGPGIATPNFPLPCGDDYECFDPSIGDCSNDSDHCIVACEISGPTCKEKCEKPGEQIAHPTDCSIRYICDVNNNPVELYCLDKDRPFFNGNDCVADEAQCCTCRKRTCVGANDGDLLLDPEDCYSFYICIGNPLEPIGPIPCPSGGIFDPITKQCDDTTKTCSNSCNIGVTPISTTPSTTECTDLASFTCPREGYFARCPYCDPSFFKCDGGTVASVTQGTCPAGTLFNPSPDYPYCIPSDDCPRLRRY